LWTGYIGLRIGAPWQALVDTVMDLWVLQKAGNFVSGLVIVSFCSIEFSQTYRKAIMAILPPY